MYSIEDLKGEKRSNTTEANIEIIVKNCTKLMKDIKAEIQEALVPQRINLQRE